MSITVLPFIFAFAFLLSGLHIALHIKADDFLLAVRTDSDGLAEVSGELSGSVVCHNDFTAFVLGLKNSTFIISQINLIYKTNLQIPSNVI